MKHFAEEDAQQLELTEGRPDNPRLKSLTHEYNNINDTDKPFVLCARHEGECIAGILLADFPFWEKTLEIISVEVCEEWRGLRIAESLVNYAIEKASELGFSYVCAGVRTRSMEDGQRFCAFLEGQGFEHICTALIIRLDIGEALACKYMDKIPEITLLKRGELDRVAFDSYRRQREKKEGYFYCPEDSEGCITRYVTNEDGRVAVAASFVYDEETVTLNDVYIEDSKSSAARFIAMYRSMLEIMQSRGITRMVSKTVNEKCHGLILKMYPEKQIEDSAEYYSIMT